MPQFNALLERIRMPTAKQFNHRLRGQAIHDEVESAGCHS